MITSVDGTRLGAMNFRSIPKPFPSWFLWLLLKQSCPLGSTTVPTEAERRRMDREEEEDDPVHLQQRFYEAGCSNARFIELRDFCRLQLPQERGLELLHLPGWPRRKTPNYT